MRGEIENIKRKQQINNFRGLLYGKITPTDVDGLIEYKNKAWVLIEVKYLENTLPFGQRLAFERLINDVSQKKQAIAIVAEHSVHNTEQDIMVDGCRVREYYLSDKKRWMEPKQEITVKHLIDKFLYTVNGE